MSLVEILILAAVLAYPTFLIWVAFASNRAERPVRGPTPSQRVVQDRGRRIAARLGGYFHPWAGLRHVVTFRSHGREAELWFGGDDPPVTSIRVDLRGLSPGALTIHPNGQGTGIGGYLGPDLKVGDRAFDAAYEVRAQPEELVLRLFTVERRPEIIATLLKLARFKRPTLDLGAQSLNVRVGQSLFDEGELLELARAADELAGFVLEITAAGPPILWGELTQGIDGECQVCGTAFDDDVVRCAACRTPHHRGCWVYVGECSTYACGQTRFV